MDNLHWKARYNDKFSFEKLDNRIRVTSHFERKKSPYFLNIQFKEDGTPLIINGNYFIVSDIAKDGNIYTGVYDHWEDKMIFPFSKKKNKIIYKHGYMLTRDEKFMYTAYNFFTLERVKIKPCFFLEILALGDDVRFIGARVQSGSVEVNCRRYLYDSKGKCLHTSKLLKDNTEAKRFLPREDFTNPNIGITTEISHTLWKKINLETGEVLSDNYISA